MLQDRRNTVVTAAPAADATYLLAQYPHGLKPETPIANGRERVDLLPIIYSHQLPILP